MQKVADRRTLVKVLKQNNYSMVESSKHEKWSNGDTVVFVPKKHSSKFSRMLAEKILKQAGLIHASPHSQYVSNN